MTVHRYVRFVVVGTLAASMHFAVAVGLVSLAGRSPQLANVGGYCAAMLTSYLGQSLWTFSQRGVSMTQFYRFAVTSFSGFALNALTYAALLHWTSLDYRIALLLVLLLVAVLTFLGLDHWVFAATRHRRVA